MSRLVLLLVVFVARVLVPWCESHAAEPKLSMRGMLGVCLSIAFWKGDSNNPVVQGSRAPDVARFCDE